MHRSPLLVVVMATKITSHHLAYGLRLQLTLRWGDHPVVPDADDRCRQHERSGHHRNIAVRVEHHHDEGKSQRRAKEDVSALVLDKSAKHSAGYAAAADRHQDGESGSDNIS